MKSLTSESQISDEELKLFFEEIDLFGNQKDSKDEPIDRLFIADKDLEPLKNNLSISSKKTRSTFWVYFLLPFVFVAGGISGWFLKPSPPQPRPLDVVGEEILLLLQQLPFPAPQPSEPSIEEALPLPGTEIIEPVDEVHDFSVA